MYSTKSTKQTVHMTLIHLKTESATFLMRTIDAKMSSVNATFPTIKLLEHKG